MTGYTMSNKILSNLVVCLFWICGSVAQIEANSVTLTTQDTLSYLVKRSDIIAIINITGGIDKKRISSFTEMPQQVDANLLKIIKGGKLSQTLTILNTPEYAPPNVLKSAIVLRNGKHLAFLNMEGKSYRPTTRFSMLPVSRGKVYPIWHQTKSVKGVTSGCLLELVISEIEMEIEFTE